MAVSTDTIVGPWGYNGGNVWSFRPVRKINEIVISYGGYGANPIALTFSCIKADGSKDTITVGKDGPDEITNIDTVNIDGSDEYLTGISGTFGIYLDNNVLRSIKFTTNEREYGPYGTVDETPFTSNIPSGYQIVGFLGRAGYYIDAIGAYITHN
ncbi:PREDICTED: mannose/glucose-specific lectin-like [Ipomoea nil]|uniref:mannose/glucose-specific lectin-like n=1 Tax=Ipomoea nil TaxID=35883 RepID=UPI0009010F9F|nr:PREDICTED: mannose/glucose-specific lectin-like [Ipomoea nil]